MASNDFTQRVLGIRAFFEEQGIYMGCNDEVCYYASKINSQFIYALFISTFDDEEILTRCVNKSPRFDRQKLLFMRSKCA